MNELPLTKKRQKWVANRETSIRGTKLMYNAAQQERYTSALNRLIRQMTGETLRSINRLFKGTISEEFFKQQMEASAMDSSAMDASISAKARILTNALTKKFSLLFSKKAGNLAAMMLEGAKAASKSSLHASLKQLSGGLSLKTGVIPPGMEDIGRAIIAENVSLIKSIPDEYFKNVTGSVMRSITKGQGIADLIPEIQKYDGQTERRAKLLALDQTRKAYNSINKVRMQATGVKQFEWVHSGGGQVPRKSHLDILNGKIFSFEHLEAEQAALGVPENDRGLPGMPINCFPGSTQVSLANGCINIWRYNYSGQVITFDMQGSSLTSTINHPILTHRGWLRADEIQEGDYLISSKINNIDFIENEKTNNITTFDNLFDTIKGKRSLEFPKTFNFHGDIPENNVDRILINDNLPCRFKSFDSQQIEKFVFALTHIISNSSGLCFDPKVFHACSTCGFRQCDSFFFGEIVHSKCTCFTSITQNNHIFTQYSINNLSASIPIFAQLQNANTCIITIQDILSVGINKGTFLGCWTDIIKSFFKCGCKMIGACMCGLTESLQSTSPVQCFLRVNKKSISEFNDHVYTMQSENEWYNVTSTEIISKNCKCTILPIIDFSD